MNSFNKEACEYDYSNPVTENFILFNSGLGNLSFCIDNCVRRYGEQPYSDAYINCTKNCDRINKLW
jgi:hypothetical protein